jgi:3-oxoacyl-[acyl-carrier protein] reductase
VQDRFRLDGKNIIVTGCGQGIGATIARCILSLGGNVIAVDVKPEGIEALAAETGAGRVLPQVTNVTRPGEVEAMVLAGAKRFGAIHGLVNNAAVVRPAMLHKMTLQQWQEVIDVDLTGVFLCLQAVARHMMERHKDGDAAPGSIVNIASEAGRGGVIGQLNYGAAKSGLCGISVSAAKELARYGIRVNTVAFGPVDTPMTQVILNDPAKRDRMMAGVPLGRLGSTEEVSLPVCFMLSDAASYITGQTLGANGGAYIST